MVAWGRVGRALRAAAHGASLVSRTLYRVSLVWYVPGARHWFPVADTTLNSHGRVLLAAVQTLALCTCLPCCWRAGCVCGELDSQHWVT
eukprot:7000108-Alexandrium_andersonii.AAC.1